MKSILTKQSGSNILSFSSNEEIFNTLKAEAKRYDVSLSSFVRLGIILASKNLQNKSKENARKKIGIKSI